MQEWREKYMCHGTPDFVQTASPTVENNPLPDMCTPPQDGELYQRIQQDVSKADFDGITIEDMHDAGFAASRFAANKFQQMDAAIDYNRTFTDNYKRVSEALKKPGNAVRR